MSRREGRLEENASLGTSALKDNSISTAKILDGAVTIAKLAPLNKVFSNATASLNATASWAASAQTATITTSGNPVSFRIIPTIGAGAISQLNFARSTNQAGLQFRIYRDSTCINSFRYDYTLGGATLISETTWYDMYTEDNPGAGTYVYSLQVQFAYSGSSAAGGISNFQIVVEEIRT